MMTFIFIITHPPTTSVPTWSPDSRFKVSAPGAALAGSRPHPERHKSGKKKSNFWRIKPTEEMLIWSFRSWDQHKHARSMCSVWWLPELNLKSLLAFLPAECFGCYHLKRMVCLSDKAIMSLGFIFMAPGIGREGAWTLRWTDLKWSSKSNHFRLITRISQGGFDAFR